MNLPDRIQIGPFRYLIITDPVAIHAENFEANQIFCGRIHLVGGKLFLETQQPPDQQRDSLLHEVLHGVLHLAGLRNELAEKEEGLVTRLAPLLLDTLRRNPDLIAFLTAEDT